jgi:predicted transcriptional regulator YdeE
MDSKSNKAFLFSGYNVTIHNPQEAQAVIQKAWQKFMQEGLSKLVEHKVNENLHAIYYNYTNLDNPELEGYDMILGCFVEDGSIQSNQGLTTISVPAQDYKYVDITSDNFQITLPIEWGKINSMPKSEVNRTHQFDLEMYSEDYKTCTLAVGVGKE